MPTLSGTLYDAGGAPWDGTFRLSLTTAPYDSEGTVVAGSKLFVDVTLGEYSQSLSPGIYSVCIPGSQAYLIGMPAGSATYDLKESKYDPEGGIPAVLAGLSYFTTLAAFRLDQSNKQLAFLSSDANTDWGWFEAKGDTAADDGVNYVINANLVVYTRKP